MRLSNFRFDCIVYLIWACDKLVPPNVYCGLLLLFSNNITSHLKVLNDIFQVTDHLYSSPMSDWKLSSSFWLQTVEYSSVSSAYKLTLHFPARGKSFIYNIRNKVGPSNKLCGTPDVTGRLDNREFHTTTFCLIISITIIIKNVMSHYFLIIITVQSAQFKLPGDLPNFF